MYYVVVLSPSFYVRHLRCFDLFIEISLEGTDMISDEGVLELTSSDLIKRNLCKITLGGCKQLSNDSLMALVARCKSIIICLVLL